MTDIVQRLLTENTMHGYYDSPAIQSEAADEIIRLRDALKYISINACDECDVSRQIALKALRGSP